jgi:hypothetical protein
MKNKIQHEYDRRIREIEEEAINKIKLAEKTYLIEAPATQYIQPSYTH